MKAVLFDLDGVIVDSEFANVGAGVRAFLDVGIRLSGKEKKFIVGRHPVDYTKILMKKYSFDFKKFVAVRDHYYDEMYKKSRLYPFAKQLVSRLKKAGFLLALVTSAPAFMVRRAQKKFGIGDFDVFVTFEDAAKRKPAPDVYLLAAKRLKVKPSECVVIEDSIPGVEAAKNAKMKCVAVTNTNPASKLRKADLIVKRLNDKRIMNFIKPRFGSPKSIFSPLSLRGERKSSRRPRRKKVVC
jgi:HAD superfamily hydrolase (TIGR01509 family)